MFSRRHYSGLALGTLCLFFFIFASSRLGERSLQRPFDGIPSLQYHYKPNQGDTDSTTWKGPYTSGSPLRPYNAKCDDFPDISNVLVVIKTGATESYAKIPTQLMTNLRCVDGFLIFSDMRQRIAGFEIYDSLETVLAEAKEGNPVFDLYRQQQTCPIDQEGCHMVHDFDSYDAWALDKYKNIHMAEKAYVMRPKYDWYLFIDADTYVVWPNLSQWLRGLDPNRDLYMGRVMVYDDSTFAHGDSIFAHGRSGYILSQAAMHRFVGLHPNVANRFDTRIEDTCCGDHMISVALNETTGIQPSQAWPVMNDEKPHSLYFGSEEWCKPIVTLHHTNSEDVSSFWEFEKQFYHNQPSSLAQQRPLLFRDVYEGFLAAKIQPQRQDWDNLSNDVQYLDVKAGYSESEISSAKKDNLSPVEKDAHKSFKHCQKMCDEVNDCLQFSYHDGICAYNRGISLGNPTRKADKGSERWMSGWAVDKIDAWIQQQGQCEEEIIWPRV
ncbi:hypothetical protein F4809DRAFT_68171 [Biscogniauxia mediterranea]|nr:hypothetical protein F4809DRAFT_68171 [Biscogniauxia mediterranea]